VKISDMTPEILQKKCKLINKPGKYIILDYIKNIHEKNNVKVYNPVTHEIFWVPFNTVELINAN
jgi:hypothetical protein